VSEESQELITKKTVKKKLQPWSALKRDSDTAYAALNDGDYATVLQKEIANSAQGEVQEGFVHMN
jgi:hypothetical protein